jgi:hypothetical protein
VLSDTSKNFRFTIADLRFPFAGSDGFPACGITGRDGRSSRWLNTPALLVIAALFLSGCAGIKPLKGGKAGFQNSSAVETNKFDLQQPENPAATASQDFARDEEETIVIPKGTVEKETNTTASTNGTTTVTKERVYSADTTATKQKTVRAIASIGPAQKDISRELAAGFANMKPVQWVGIALILLSGAFLYFKWWTPAAISAGFGVGLLIFAHTIVGNERLLIVLLSFGLCLLGIFYAYRSGTLDPVLPDALDKNKKG